MAEPLLKPVRDVVTVTVALLPGITPVTVTNPPELTVVFPEVEVALYVNFESKFVIATVNPDVFEVGVAKVGFNAFPLIADPDIVPVVVVNPTLETEIVTLALWPAIKFEIVMGNVDPVTSPFTTVPAVVLTL